MSVENSYDRWASQYDSDENKTRDLEGDALRMMLSGSTFSSCLEIGCGTGKNTQWLIDRSSKVMAIDLSKEMLSIARSKIQSDKVRFVQADIRNSWTFAEQAFDLITFSLVLEHIQDLGPVFSQTSKLLKSGGLVYIGELHPYKQYAGTKAGFNEADQKHVVECYNHHITDFIENAWASDLHLRDLKEFFDQGASASLPRILAILLEKP